jgi:hypothetical protein
MELMYAEGVVLMCFLKALVKADALVYPISSANDCIE